MQACIYELHNAVLYNAFVLHNLVEMYTEDNAITDLKSALQKERLVKVTRFPLMTMQAGFSIHYIVILHCYN